MKGPSFLMGMCVGTCVRAGTGQVPFLCSQALPEALGLPNLTPDSQHSAPKPGNP